LFDIPFQSIFDLAFSQKETERKVKNRLPNRARVQAELALLER
jgi:hypothetical protein